jgi:hypothetical protein
LGGGWRRSHGVTQTGTKLETADTAKVPPTVTAPVLDPTLIARGSAMECVAVFDLALSRRLVSSPAYRHGRGLLVRLVQMLTKLAQRMQA